jgi:hypothetical protein
VTVRSAHLEHHFPECRDGLHGVVIVCDHCGQVTVTHRTPDGPITVCPHAGPMYQAETLRLLTEEDIDGIVDRVVARLREAAS